MTTVKQIAEKVSLLRSRVAVYEGWLHHLQSNYVGTADTPPESVFLRADYGAVPREHLDHVMALVAEMISTAEAEIAELEALVIVPLPTPTKEKKDVAPRTAGRSDRRTPAAGHQS